MPRRDDAARPRTTRPHPRCSRAAPPATPPRDEPAIDLLGLLWALDHGLHVRSKLMGRTLGVTGPQRLAMRVIEHAPGISAHELAARLRVHKSTLSGILQRLEARSVVTRHADPDDGRRRALVVTPAGLALLHRAAPTIEAEVTAVLGEFDPAEVEVVRRLLSRLAARLADPPDRPSASAAALASAGTTRRVPA